MRKVCAGLMMTLDGVTDAPNEWSGPYFVPEMGQVMAEGIANADTILLGRRTYLEFAEMWPPQGDSNPMAAFLNQTPKYVASSTIDKVEWSGSELIKGDVVEAVKELKSRPGKNIQVPGSPRLVRSLLAAGVLDELSLMIFPVVLGAGNRLFEDGTSRMALELTGSGTYSSGVVGAQYAPAK
ncbi:dihydrofolate reductase family protein [Actinomadura rupiterrae]|uniref:dihydrofolate reductase family protein n=1 Tax=Actinomadura rupiterrae TaxID=559627 RepID=UPI0020A49969|nr:dihydrofolate reductase family protein [Actinomadura rupiterrae]MCP2336083.1 dihydrofolate reductase [Actinomadura rupiterrae]